MGEKNTEMEEKRLITFEGVKKFKSIKRAIRKGLVTGYGTLIPKRPFNNRKNTSKYGNSRETNEYKKQMYETFKKYRRLEASGL